MNTSSISQIQIQAYVDGQLGDEERIAVENYLAQNPSEADKVQDYKHQNVLLHQFYDPILVKPLPTRVTQLPHSKYQRYKYAAAIFLSLCIGGIAGWEINDLNQYQTKETMALANQAVLAHVVYVPEIRHPVEVAADAQEHLVRWLSKRLKNDIKAPNLQQEGYQLVGGRLLPADTGPAAQFMYENASGLRLTLFVRINQNHKGDTGFRFNSQNGINVFYWVDGALGYALSGEIAKDDLWKAADIIYKQLGI